jgi:outer membrane protein TolC
MRRAPVLFTVLTVALVGGASRQAAPQATGATAPTDTLRLSALLADAVRNDPRQAQLALQSRATSLRLRSIDAERLPSLTSVGQAQYASRVITIPIRIPGAALPQPLKDTYDAHVEAMEPLFDPTRAPRRSLERSQLAENQAGVRVSVFGLRGEVQDAFFAAAADQQRAASIDATILDLEARLADARKLFHAGAALPGDTATIAATLIQRRQDAVQLRADEHAALSRLEELVGRSLPASAVLALPEDGLAAAADSARAAVESGDDPRARPEFAQFAATRSRLAAQEAQVDAARRPQLSAFVHGGIGRPGLNPFSQEFQGYWTAGVQFHWAPWNWGTYDRDREELEVQREIVATNERAFNESLRRSVQGDLATIDRLASTLALDDSIVALREIALREARAQLAEGAITAPGYLDRTTDLLAARLTRTEHRVSLAQARLHLLNTLGLEIPTLSSR